MDIFSHALWTNVLYRSTYRHQIRDRMLAVFFGVMPDVISFTPIMLYALVTGMKFPRPPFELHHPLFTYAVQSYNYTHSLVVFGLVFLIVLAVRRGKMYWPLLGWAFHILLDIPTHTDFFATPFLYPLSNFKNHYGLSWAEPHFLIVDWAVLIAVYSYLFYQWRKSKRINSPSRGQ